MRTIVGASAIASALAHRFAQGVDLGEAAPERQDGAVGAPDGDEDRLFGARGAGPGNGADEMGVAVGSIDGRLVGSPSSNTPLAS